MRVLRQTVRQLMITLDVKIFMINVLFITLALYNPVGFGSILIVIYCQVILNRLSVCAKAIVLFCNR